MYWFLFLNSYTYLIDTFLLKSFVSTIQILFIILESKFFTFNIHFLFIVYIIVFIKIIVHNVT